MSKSIAIAYFFAFLAPVYAQAPMTDIELIELLGEFDQEDATLLEESMQAVSQEEKTDKQETDQSGVTHENEYIAE